MWQTIEAWSIKPLDMLEDGASVVKVTSREFEQDDALIVITLDNGEQFEVPYWETLTVWDEN